MKAELEKLIDLQKTDSNIRRLKKSIETADERRAGIEQEFEQHAFSIREIQGNRDRLHAERAELEKQIAENRTYLERADRNLKHAQNQKEYETAMRETDAIQKQIAAYETQIIEQMTAVEEVEKELEGRAEPSGDGCAHEVADRPLRCGVCVDGARRRGGFCHGG